MYKKIRKLVKRIIIVPLNLVYKIKPEVSLKIVFYLRQGHKLNLKNPRTYNEKINWLKLYYRNDLMPKCADKYTVRSYVEDCGLGHILNELLWEGFDPKEIPFDDLPNKFVIKVTHGSGNNIICEDKDKLDIDKTIKKLNKWLNKKYLPSYGEWFYGKIKPRIIIEKFLEDKNYKVPVDYKMYYFNNINGKKDIAFTAIDTNRFVNLKRVVYDRQWNRIENIYLNYPNDENASFEKPKLYKEMVEYAKILAKPFPHVRVDFYIINDKIFFGELSFTNEAGFGKIKPQSLNLQMGEWIKLPPKNV